MTVEAAAAYPDTVTSCHTPPDALRPLPLAWPVAALDGVPLALPEPADEPPHAATINVTAASPADASHLLRIEFPFTRGLAHMMSGPLSVG
jgi:hypothetical protein